MPEQDTRPLMKLDEFLESGVQFDVKTASGILSLEDDLYPDDHKIWIFAASCFIVEHPDGKFSCEIFHDTQIFDDQDAAAGCLYAEFFITECNDSLTPRIREDDGTLDSLVGDLLIAMPEIDPSSDDWGGIMGIAFSDVSKDVYSINEVYNICRDAARTYGNEDLPSGTVQPFG